MKNPAKHAFLTVIIALSLAIVAGVMILQQAQLRTLGSQIKNQTLQTKNISVQTQRNGEAVVNYLDCIGHIPKPVVDRTQADYDKCLDNMRDTVNGK